MRTLVLCMLALPAFADSAVLRAEGVTRTYSPDPTGRIPLVRTVTEPIPFCRYTLLDEGQAGRGLLLIDVNLGGPFLSAAQHDRPVSSADTGIAWTIRTAAATA